MVAAAMVAAGTVPNMVAAGTGQALSDMAADTVAADTARLCRTRWRQASGSPGVRQSRHCQRGVAIAIRACAIPRRILRFGLALVAWRSRPRLVRTAVLAIRPL